MAWIKGAEGVPIGIKLSKRKYTSIAATLGVDFSNTAPANGIKADSLDDVSRNGVFFLNLSYEVPGGKTQRTTVPCATDKADTAFKQVIGQEWDGKKIVSVKTPR
ncbi:hypothetical protein [Coleofasciculus sp. F4-SAH-05]|uniref:hypothetical protein n=1 Tax=Coleofasciculus sp. F4-SAH-05 TaxID=3069525 RepID=UPI004064AC8F